MPGSGEPTWFAWADWQALHISDAAKGKDVGTFPFGRIVGLAASPDGNYLLAANVRDGFFS